MGKSLVKHNPQVCFEERRKIVREKQRKKEHCQYQIDIRSFFAKQNFSRDRNVQLLRIWVQ